MREVVGTGAGDVDLHEPRLAGNEWAYVKECLDSAQVSSLGRFGARFEQGLEAFTGAGHAVATASGTAALHVSLIVAGVRPGDEVLTPALTFVATANAVRYCGAIPHFVDSEERSLGLDPLRLEAHLAEETEMRGEGCWNRATGRPLTAVLAVHTFGHPADLDALERVCQRFRLTLLEDAASALGSWHRGRHAGTVGRVGALSFNGNKIVTTGNGGAVLTNDAELARRARHLVTTAKRPHPWAFFHDEVAFNYRLSNLNAALGCAQLEQLPDFVARKRALARRYREAFREIQGVRVFEEPPYARSNCWLSALLLDPAYAASRDEILARAHRAGIRLRPAWTPLHLLPMFAGCPRMDLTVAETLAARLVSMPSSAGLGEPPAPV